MTGIEQFTTNAQNLKTNLNYIKKKKINYKVNTSIFYQTSVYIQHIPIISN